MIALVGAALFVLNAAIGFLWCAYRVSRVVERLLEVRPDDGPLEGRNVTNLRWAQELWPAIVPWPLRRPIEAYVERRHK